MSKYKKVLRKFVFWGAVDNFVARQKNFALFVKKNVVLTWSSPSNRILTAFTVLHMCQMFHIGKLQTRILYIVGPSSSIWGKCSLCKHVCERSNKEFEWFYAWTYNPFDIFHLQQAKAMIQIAVKNNWTRL